MVTDRNFEEQEVHITYRLNSKYSLLAIFNIEKNCCRDCIDPAHFLLTKANLNGVDSYSCQCCCGKYFTNGHSHMKDALKDYYYMSGFRFKKENF